MLLVVTNTTTGDNMNQQLELFYAHLNDAVVTFQNPHIKVSKRILHSMIIVDWNHRSVKFALIRKIL